MVWLQVVAAAGVAVLSGAALVRAPALVESLASLHRRWRRRGVVQPEAPPVEQLAADLHRLAVQLAEVERSDATAKVARLRATTLAYDDVLLTACRALQITPPGSPPLQPIERLETEAALAQEGLVW